MRSPELHSLMIKRLLFYDIELQRLKIDSNTAIQFISYMFSIKEQRIVKVLGKYSIDELKDVTLIHSDLDLIIIDSFVKKVQREARMGGGKSLVVSS